MCLSCILAFLLEDCQGGKFQQHQITFLPIVSRWPKKYFFEGVQSLSACLSDKSTLKMEMSRSIGGMMLAGKRQSTWRKTSLIAALSKTHFIRIYLDLNPRNRSAKTFNFPLIAASFFLRWAENGKSNILHIHSILLPI
jgi:hypothetical protein